MTDTDLVLVERTGPIATLTINRPSKLNALNAELVAELARVFEALATEGAGEDAVRAAILTGAGKAFVAGADIGEMAEMTPVAAKRFADAGQRLCHRIETLPFPVIAAVNGFALGGGSELALSCDFIYAAEGAKLGLPEVTLGVMPGFGGTQRLLRRVGAARARELVYTGDMVSAEQALAIGLVNAVHPAAELVQKARETAQKIASRGPLAVAAAKRVMLHGEGVDLASACEHEAQAFAGLFGSEDQREGMKAFLAKTKPTFVGR
ncbi:enoyl-CoA hydratase/isomerase family protein [Polyangium jinanense]|uniref:Enoyl-CoA hydratase/isomerase family protein n=1 Tax=Polyangium jinanense TaxID=2829994 RepID=A0A9X3X3A9_9BACT|nr:enoyl-CoA hydratase-related protein [Polyangium jinanense]MDC3952948.1 enoyl-CoA hydratase/isomerase family protein [Polyangium jinanense]MDC3980566.1 enoyl-CoA hydratase/isomerase family protein [Polyangium jinanense]